MADHVLVVEDDPTIHRHLRDALAARGYDVDAVTGGRAALDAVARRRPDLVLLDLGLPDVDGVEVCRSLRTLAPATTIVMLTARDAEIDVIVGLDAGADDYLVKPFRLAELLARVAAHLRRARGADPPARRIDHGDLTVDLAARRAFLGGDELDLRPKEFDLLALLVREAGRAVTRDRIMAEVWDAHWHGPTKTLDMHISALRRKLGDGPDAGRITTLRGVGYRLEEP